MNDMEHAEPSLGSANHSKDTTIVYMHVLMSCTSTQLNLVLHPYLLRDVHLPL